MGGLPNRTSSRHVTMCWLSCTRSTSIALLTWLSVTPAAAARRSLLRQGLRSRRALVFMFMSEATRRGRPIIRADSIPPTRSLDLYLCRGTRIRQTLQDVSGRPVRLLETKRPEWHRREGVDITPQFLGVLADHGYQERSDDASRRCSDERESAANTARTGVPPEADPVDRGGRLGESATRYAPLRAQQGLDRLARTVDGIGPWIRRAYRVARKGGAIRSTGLVQRAHKAGLAVHPYTFRADELPEGFASFDALLAFFIDNLLIDGLFTDFPDQAVAIYAKDFLVTCL